MKKKTKVIASSALSIAVCASLIAGSTFALFSSESNVNIAITSGKVDVVASVSQMWTASSITGEYSWTAATGSDTLSGTFENKGTAKYESGKLTLENISPGDAVKFKLEIENNSTIAIKYQLRATSTKDEGGLFQHLTFKFGEEEVKGTGPILTNNEWTAVEPEGEISEAEFIIELPYKVGNEAMGLSCDLSIGVLAVQGNAHYDEEAIVNEIPSSAGTATVDEEEESVKLESNNHLVIIEVPADDIEDGTEELKLTVTPASEEEKSKFEIEELAGASAVYYDIEVTGVKEATGDPFQVSIYVGKNLRTVQVYHWIEEEGSEGKKEYIEGVEYNKETGFITFKTTSFSPFAIIGYDSVVPDVDPSNAKPEEIVNAINAAIEEAKEGETVFLPAGEYKVDGSSIKLDKNITLRGEEGTKFVTSQSVKGLFDIATEDVTIENLEFSLTEQNVNDFAFIKATADNFTVRNCTFEGQYEEGQNNVSRAIVPNAGVKGFVIEGNTFKNIRQPAYLEGEGTVRNNYVSGTRGFVVTCNHKVEFVGNRFSDNAEDIAVIANNDADNLYTVADALEMSKNNNNAVVDIQPLGIFVTGGTIDVKGKDSVTASDALITVLTYINTLKDNTTPITIKLGEGTFSPTAGDQFKILADHITLQGEGADKTTIDTKDFNCSSMAGFVVSGNNCSVDGIKFVTESSSNGVDAMKVTQLSTEADEIIHNFTLTNAEFEGNLSHALNIHGVDGARVENVKITKYSKCGISFAKATGVRLSNVDITKVGGWADIGFMYGDGEAYKTPCDVTIDFTTCKFANGSIYSERPAEAEGGADVIRSGGKEIANGDTVTDAYYASEKPEHMTECVLVMRVADGEGVDYEGKDIPAGTWKLVRKATFEMTSETMDDVLESAKGTFTELVFNLSEGTYQAGTWGFKNVTINGADKEKTIMRGVAFGTNDSTDKYAGGCWTLNNVTVKYDESDSRQIGVMIASNEYAKDCTLTIENCVIDGFEFGTQLGGSPIENSKLIIRNTAFKNVKCAISIGHKGNEFVVDETVTFGENVTNQLQDYRESTDKTYYTTIEEYESGEEGHEKDWE